VRRLRWPLRVLAALVLLLALATGAGWLWLRRSLPETQGTLHVRGLSAPVKLERDRFGVPTIRAATVEDALYGLGYAHAQDRFFQMEMSRRAAAGRLSEVAGRDTLEIDTLARALGLSRVAEADEPRQSAPVRAALAAYAAGVNAWLDGHRDRLPPELGLLRLYGRAIDPAPWRAADSLAFSKLMALDLSLSFRNEILRADVIAKLGDAGAALFPPADGPSIVGSNSWAIAPSRSATGHPLLANDPHLSIGSPSDWYIVRLEAPGLSVAGVTLPGLPAVIIGKNARIAWGMTNMAADTQDLFIERADAIVDTRREEIRVAGEKAPVIVTVRATKHGPIVKDDWNGQLLSLRWPGLDAGDTGLEAFLAIDRAGNWSEFKSALAGVVTPPSNFVYADVDGHIGYFGAGKLPIRGRGDGSVPLPGWEPDSDWRGYLPFDKQPQRFDPPDGLVVTANNRVLAGDTLPGYYAPSFRAQRIRELIESKPKLALDDFAEMQRDCASGLARALLPRLLSAKATGAREQAALERLRGWDRVESSDSVAGAIFVAWYRRLLEPLFADELGPELFKRFAGERPRVVESALAEPSGRWCDDVSTPARESCDQIAGRALSDALDELSARLGPDMQRWQLGALLTTRFVNHIASPLPLVGRLWTRAVHGLGGDPQTVRVSGLSRRRPFEVSIHSSFFALFDLAPGGAARITLTLGQSAHPLSPHFDDQLESWRRAIARPLEGAGETLELAP
jgi:penicillin amidase